MREILFRGKRIDKGEWVNGCLVKGNKSYIISRDNFVDAVVSLDGHLSTFTDIVDEKTIGQFTGLKDKNGTKIFEGDIVKGTIVSQWAKQEIVCCVEYQKDGFVCIEQDKWEHKLKFAKTIEIIGNIYDNHELLEGL